MTYEEVLKAIEAVETVEDWDRAFDLYSSEDVDFGDVDEEEFDALFARLTNALYDKERKVKGWRW